MLRFRPDNWFLRDAGGERVPATVPGCVHTDLRAAGLIPDPFADANEVELAWIGRADWTYETRFDWAPAGEDRVDLVCDGLDTVATITLNGTELGRTYNMHRSYRFDARPALRPGGNQLTVRFDSALRHAEALRDRLGARPHSYAEPFNLIRKMACNFGWDWGPTLVTAGIWRPIGLHAWRVARLARVVPRVTVEAGEGRVELHVALDRAADAPLTLTAAVGDVRRTVGVGAGQREAVVTLTVPGVSLWWPRGYGEQPRYPVAVTLADPGGEPLDTWQRRIGFRSVRLDTAPDAHGTPFALVVNDEPVFVRGVNWIPDDAFPSRMTRERYATRLAQACEAGVNYVRVWGGGIYESDDFYDVADEYGLLVGQDFLFACAAYPEEEPLRAEVAAEARDDVVRLASHPSLVMWVGNNENLWGWHDWGWQEPLAGRTWGAGYYFDLLPAIVAELDPTRPYWPGSPYSGTPELHPNDPAHGTTHIWDVWNRRDYTHYRSYAPRFVAEFGYQAPATYATLRAALTDDPLAPDSPGMRHHQKAPNGMAKLRQGLAAHLPEPRDNFDDWHYLTQVNQARAIAVAVEHFRALMPVCMGAIVWQLNDCWPAISWSAIDSAGRRKPLWYALRHAFADRLLTIQPRDGGLALMAVNDAADPWHGRVDVARLTLAGQPCATAGFDLAVPARAAVTLPLPAAVSTPDAAHGEVLVADGAGTERAWWFFAEDWEIPYPRASYDATVDGAAVTVTAHTVLRDLTLFPDRLDPAATVDRALITLLPGESTTFTVHADAPLDPAALTRPPVLRCVNDLPQSGTRR